MRIAIIGHKRIPGREGGIEVVVEELATRMSALGHDVTVYNRKNKTILPLKTYNGVHLITVPTIEKKVTDAVVNNLVSAENATNVYWAGLREKYNMNIHDDIIKNNYDATMKQLQD